MNQHYGSRKCEIYGKKGLVDDDGKKENYMRYGTIYGKKYCVKTTTEIGTTTLPLKNLEKFIAEYYKKLRKGGTLIMFFDLWKIGELKELFEKHKFKQIRFIEWIKTNPQPLNSKVNYLTNCRNCTCWCERWKTNI